MVITPSKDFVRSGGGSSEPPHVTNPQRGVAMSAKRSHQMDGLFPCEAEVARRLSQDPKEWQAKAIVLERDGLPRIDPIMGGRYWPAVEAYWNLRYGLSRIQASQPDGEENLHAL